jgi:hypothetical protein
MALLFLLTGRMQLLEADTGQQPTVIYSEVDMCAHQCDAFDRKRRKSQKALHDESRENALDL